MSDVTSNLRDLIAVRKQSGGQLSPEDRLLWALRKDEGHVLITGPDIESAHALLESVLINVDSARTIRANAADGPDAAVAELVSAEADSLPSAIDKREAAAELVNGAQTAGKKILIIIEDADEASVDDLERMRNGMNLTENALSTVKLVLVGTRELIQTLTRPSARALTSRITARVEAGPIAKKRRAARAGGGLPKIVTRVVLSTACLAVFAVVPFMKWRAGQGPGDATVQTAPAPVEVAAVQNPGSEQSQTAEAIPAGSADADAPAARAETDSAAVDTDAAAKNTEKQAAAVETVVDGDENPSKDLAGAEHAAPQRTAMLFAAPTGARKASGNSGAGDGAEQAAAAPARPDSEPRNVVPKAGGAPVAAAETLAALAPSERNLPMAEIVEREPSADAQREQRYPETRISALDFRIQRPETLVAPAPAGRVPAHAANEAPSIAQLARRMNVSATGVAKIAATVTPDTDLTLQVGAFSDLQNASKLREALLKRFDRVFVTQAERDGSEIYRVRIDGFDSHAQLESAESLLRSLGFQPKRITRRES